MAGRGDLGQTLRQMAKTQTEQRLGARLWSQTVWIQIPGGPLPTGGTLGKLFNFLICTKGIIIVPISQHLER